MLGAKGNLKGGHCREESFGLQMLRLKWLKSMGVAKPESCQTKPRPILTLIQRNDYTGITITTQFIVYSKRGSYLLHRVFFEDIVLVAGFDPPESIAQSNRSKLVCLKPS